MDNPAAQGSMLRLVTGMSANKGFTLIELLIVLVIIGVTIGFAFLAFGDFGASRRILFSAEQLVNTIQLAQHQAILENSTLGLQIDSQGYQILKFHPPASWKPIGNKGIFKTVYFPDNTEIVLKTNSGLIRKTPGIMIDSSGEIYPFALTFRTHKEGIVTTLTVNQNGQLILNANNTK